MTKYNYTVYKLQVIGKHDIHDIKWNLKSFFAAYY